MLGKNNVEVIKGFARFVDAHSVEVNGEIITADHILIATGGRPSHPSIPGAEYGIDSDGFFELDALPKRTAVVGAGYIAIELAGVVNALGSETHLFVRKQAPLRSFDPLLTETLVEVMNREGPALHTESVPEAVIKNSDGSLTLQLENGSDCTVDCWSGRLAVSPPTITSTLKPQAWHWTTGAISKSINSRTPVCQASMPWATTPVRLN